MKHCKGCSHPTICNTHGCGAEEARANKAKADLKVRPESPKLTGVAERKLTGLVVEDGFRVNGVAIRNDQTGQQGFITDGGLVGWWQPENDAQTVKAQLDELLEALRKALNALPRYSFLMHSSGGVARVEERSGRWIEWSKAHDLFDPAMADKLLGNESASAKAEGTEGGAA